jgi:uncharacterized protein YcnI
VNLVRRSFLAAAIVVACIAPAAAHVTVKPATVAAGTIATLTFRCPNELAPASTTELIVQMPAGNPFAYVDVVPTNGWHVTITRRTLAQPIAGPHGSVTSAVDTIAWTGSISGGAAQTFTIHAGPMPHGPSELAFKALQRYSNDTIVRWIELRNPGEAEPAFPAPVVQVR